MAGKFQGGPCGVTRMTERLRVEVEKAGGKLSLSKQRAADLAARQEEIAKQAKIIRDLLELGDHRLLAQDGPCNNQKPDLSPDEWGRVYRACGKIVRIIEGKR